MSRAGLFSHHLGVLLHYWSDRCMDWLSRSLKINIAFYKVTQPFLLLKISECHLIFFIIPRWPSLWNLESWISVSFRHCGNVLPWRFPTQLNRRVEELCYCWGWPQGRDNMECFCSDLPFYPWPPLTSMGIVFSCICLSICYKHYRSKCLRVSGIGLKLTEVMHRVF